MHVRIASTALAFLLATGFAANSPTSQGKAPPAGGSYKVDSEHTTVLLRVKHVNTSWTFCRFNRVSGEFTVDAAKPENSNFKVQIAAASIDSGQSARDGHLKSPDFLDAAQFPDITYTSQSVQKAGEGKYKAEGELSLHGVKKPLTVELEEVGTSDTQFGVRAGYFGTFTVQRSDFGMDFMPEAVGDEIHVTVSIEGIRADAKAK